MTADVRSPAPDPSRLIAALDLDLPLIGFYDAPSPQPFDPVVKPRHGSGRGSCVFDFFEHWRRGDTLHLTRERFGCGGAGRALCEARTRGRDDFIDFLWGDEGLRATRDLMAGWIDNSPVYHPRHDHVLIGPLRDDQYGFARSVTFWVDPDQLSVLLLGAYHHHAWGEPDPVTAPFGSGCMELVANFRDLDAPQAAIGATDVAMRGQVPPHLLAFTVTPPMYARLCALDDESFLGKRFLASLRRARGGRLGAARAPGV